MNLKLKKSDINLLLMLAGVLLAVLSYFLVYQNLTASTETLKAENAVLDEEVAYLQELANNKQRYIDETTVMQTEIDNIKAQFPAEYRAEDDILYIVGLQEKYEITPDSIQMDPAAAIEVVTEAQAEAAEAAAAETAEEGTVVDDSSSTTETAPEVSAPEIQLFRTPVTLEMFSDYGSVKDVIKTINTDENRKSIDTINIEFDTQTGQLKTVLGFSLYSLSGTEAIYITPEVKGIKYGTKNIFNSAEKKAAIDAEKEAQDEADAATEEEEE